MEQGACGGKGSAGMIEAIWLVGTVCLFVSMARADLGTGAEGGR